MGDIKTDAEAIRDRIRELQGEVEVERARLRVVQARCRHPNKFKYSVQGDMGEKCPECGWAN